MQGRCTMSVIVFAVGRPGSGKSTAIRHIMALAKSKYVTTHLRDYTILLSMSKQDEHLTKFCLNEHEGFDVTDFSVLDIALDQLEEQILYLSKSDEYDIIFVEFARDAYEKVFQRFSPALLKDAYILFVEAALNVCIKRVYERAVELHGPDHHFLSDKIMMTYYKEDHWFYMNNFFEEQFGIKRQHLKTIYNDGSLPQLEANSEAFAVNIFQEVCRQKEDNEEATQRISQQQEIAAEKGKREPMPA